MHSRIGSLLVAIWLSCGSALAADKYTIGVSLPLSGGAASEGQDLQKILLFANRELGGGRFRLIFEDDKCDNREAVSIAQKFVSIDHVDFVLGYACSGALLAAAPIYEHAQVITIGLATGAPEISAAGDFIYRTIPSLEIAGQRLAQHAAKTHQRLAIISEETAYCRGIANAVERYALRPLKIDRLEYPPETADFRSLLLKLKARGADAVFLNPQDEQGMIKLYRQFLDLGWRVQVYAAYYPGFAEFKKTFGARADGIVFADLPFISALDPRGTELYSQYVREDGKPQSSEFYSSGKKS